MKENEKILILDFGGQYNQLIARRVRECNVYSEVVPFNISLEKIKEINPRGIIFTGGPASVYGEDSPKCDPEIFNLGIPVLGICYGMQLMTVTLGGNVARASKREYGTTDVSIDNESLLFQGFENTNGFLMSHTDFVEKVPEGFKNIGHTSSCPNAAIENLTATTLRNIIGELDLDATLTSRDVINTKMRAILDEATDKWGIKDENTYKKADNFFHTEIYF